MVLEDVDGYFCKWFCPNGYWVHSVFMKFKHNLVEFNVVLSDISDMNGPVPIEKKIITQIKSPWEVVIID